MKSKTLRNKTKKLRKESVQCGKIHASLSRIMGSPATAARANEFLGRRNRALKDLDAILGETLDYAETLEEKNRKLTARTAELEIDYKRLLTRYRQELGTVPKSMGMDKKKNGAGTTDKDPKNPGQPADKKKEEGKRGAPKGHRGASRPVPENFDHEEYVAPPKTCHCGCCTILPMDEYDDLYIEDIPPIMRVVTRQRYQRGLCANCGAKLRHEEAVNGPPVVTGPNLGVLLTIMRQAGLTYGKLATMTTELLDIPLTAPGVLGIVTRMAEQLRPSYEEIKADLKQENVLNIDETGWKMNYQNAYIWCLCNPRLAWFHPNKSRAGQVVKDILGEDYKGTVVCDFYGGYNFFKNLQRCLVHFMRDVHTERKLLPGSVQLERFEAAIKDLIDKGLEAAKLPEGDIKKQTLAELEKTLDKITKIPVPKGRPTTLRKRLIRHRDELLAFACTPGVEYHNNRAERQIRPTVVNRKNSYGSATEKGAEHTCILNSVVETCRLNDKKPVGFIRSVFDSAKEILPSIFTDPKPISV